MANYVLPNTGYKPSPSPIDPNNGQAPNTAMNWLAPGSTLATDLSITPNPLVGLDITPTIIDATRQQFKIMRLLYENAIRYKKNWETYDFERPWDRLPVVSNDTDTGGGSTQTITMTSTADLSPQAYVFYPDGVTQAIVQSITGNDVVLKAATGKTLPSVSVGDVFTIAGYGKGDGANYVSGYNRLGVNQKRFLIGRIERSKRYTRLEKQTLINNGKTNYYEEDMEQMMRLIKQDAFAMYFYAKEGVYDFTSGGASSYKMVSPNGVLSQLQSGGAANANTTTASFIYDFKTLADNTNLKNEDAPRFLVGTNRILDLLSTSWKEPVHYAPNDTIASLNLKEYSIGSMKFVPVQTELMRESSFLFPKGVENTLLCLDLEHIAPICMEGFQPFEFTKIEQDLRSGKGYNDYEEYNVQAMVGTQVDVLDGHFYMNIEG